MAEPDIEKSHLPLVFSPSSAAHVGWPPGPGVDAAAAVRPLSDAACARATQTYTRIDIFSKNTSEY